MISGNTKIFDKSVNSKLTNKFVTLINNGLVGNPNDSIDQFHTNACFWISISQYFEKHGVTYSVDSLKSLAGYTKRHEMIDLLDPKDRSCVLILLNILKICITIVTLTHNGSIVCHMFGDDNIEDMIYIGLEKLHFCLIIDFESSLTMTEKSRNDVKDFYEKSCSKKNISLDNWWNGIMASARCIIKQRTNVNKQLLADEKIAQEEHNVYLKEVAQFKEDQELALEEHHAYLKEVAEFKNNQELAQKIAEEFAQKELQEEHDANVRKIAQLKKDNELAQQFAKELEQLEIDAERDFNLAQKLAQEYDQEVARLKKDQDYAQELEQIEKNAEAERDAKLAQELAQELEQFEKNAEAERDAKLAQELAQEYEQEVSKLKADEDYAQKLAQEFDQEEAQLKTDQELAQEFAQFQINRKNPSLNCN